MGVNDLSLYDLIVFFHNFIILNFLAVQVYMIRRLEKLK